MQPRRGKILFKGVRVRDMKYLAANVPIEEMPAPEIVSVCLCQHVGKPSIRVVEEGDKVRRGQLIGKAGGFIGANIHSPVSGIVTGMERRQAPNGTVGEYVVIKNDGTDDAEFLPPLSDGSGEAIVKRIGEAGIVGLGGAGFPTAVKLRPESPVDTLIVNGAECEPYLTCDYRLMLEKTEEVAAGIRLLAKALGGVRVIIGIEANKPEAIEKFAAFEDFEVVVLKKAYPMGSEKHLIYSCSGRKVRPGKLPAAAGCIVDNVATAYAVYEAVELGKPLYERVLTVSGKGITQPKNLLVKNGTSYDDILNFCGGIKEGTALIVSGGPMMGVSLFSTDVYTRKTDSGILALDGTETKFEAPTPCIHCGACAAACPMNLMPMLIDFYTQAGEYDKAEKYGGVRNCINCGCCAYVCPARRSIIQSVALCKKKLAERDAKIRAEAAESQTEVKE